MQGVKRGSKSTPIPATQIRIRFGSIYKFAMQINRCVVYYFKYRRVQLRATL